MKISFSKISSTKYPFKVDYDNATLEGFLFRKDDLVCLNGVLKACMPHCCDRCGDDIELEFTNNVNICISDGIYQDKDEELSDTIEFYDGYIDLLYILHSEVESYLSDYFYCNQCEENEKSI